MSAVLSPCGAYRYRLERDVAMEGSWGLNPWSGDDPDKRIDAAREGAR